MAAEPRAPRILDLKPLLKRRAGTPTGSRAAAGGRDTPTRPGSFDFVDLVDDTPLPGEEAANPDPREARPFVTRTWQVFLAMLAIGVVIGVAVSPLIFLFNGDFQPDEAAAILFVTVLTGVVTGYLNYRVSRGVAGRLLQRVRERGRALFHLTDAGPDHALQASEIDRLDEALAGLLGELKAQLDRQKRTQRNDLIQTITALATAIEARDPYTRNHSRSVARWSVRLGRALGLKRDLLYEIHLAGLMHDIGKIGVPDGVLLKPGKLTPDELRSIQSHVEWSYSIISPIAMLKQVSAIVRHHHERYDGRGYPDGIAGEAIPLGSRIMAVVDMFVAMTENRPYRQGLSVETAVAELRRVSGSQIDPHCMVAFVALLESDGLIPADASAAPGPVLTVAAPIDPETSAQAEVEETGSKRAAAN